MIRNIADPAVERLPNGAARGASECVACEKPMRVCWDVVCSKCGGTFCYDHAVAVAGYWFCESDAPGGAA